MASNTSLEGLHIFCERNVGMFSLIQQVVANIPWALAEHRIPIVYFSKRCAYWTPEGYADRQTVWEYYFEPLFPEYSVNEIPDDVLEAIELDFPKDNEIGQSPYPNIWVSNHFGDHRNLKGKTLSIPYKWDDPDEDLRRVTAELIRKYVRPRFFICQKTDAFFEREMQGHYVIGVHVRGTDAVSSCETRAFRKGSLNLENFARTIGKKLESVSDARIFVATDDQNSLDYLRGTFGNRVIACDSLRHQGGEVTAQSSTGALIPAYILGNQGNAARNGEEAIIEYLLLCRCQHLVHNGDSLARTVLLSRIDIAHANVHHPKAKARRRSKSRPPKKLPQAIFQQVLRIRKLLKSLL